MAADSPALNRRGGEGDGLARVLALGAGGGVLVDLGVSRGGVGIGISARGVLEGARGAAPSAADSSFSKDGSLKSLTRSIPRGLRTGRCKSRLTTFSLSSKRFDLNDSDSDESASGESAGSASGSTYISGLSKCTPGGCTSFVKWTRFSVVLDPLFFQAVLPAWLTGL